MDGLIFDADTHYYEPMDAFTRHAPTSSRSSKRIRWARTDDGRPRLLIGDRLYNSIADPTFDPVRRPGSLTEMFRLLHEGNSISKGGTDPLSDLMPCDAAFRNRDARLAAMDAQGVQACMMFPTLGVTVEEFMTDDAEFTYDSLHAFNQWLDEDWGFDYRGRIFGVPLISMLDPVRAVAELDWAMARGARAIHIRPGPTFGRSPADPEYDPFWARLNEAGLLVTLHAAESGYNALAARWGEAANPPAHLISPFQWTTCFGDRAVFETVAAYILHNLFGKFPNLRVASIENGTLWIPYLLSWIDKAYEIGRHVPTPGGRLKTRPSELFHQHIYVSPHHEEEIGDVVELLGADRILLGSDWPHAEGLSRPAEYAEAIGALDEASSTAIRWANAATLVSATAP